MSNKDSWVVMEFSPKGEAEALQGTLVKRIMSITPISKEDIFIPLIRGGRKPLWLMEGYLFIKSGYSTNDYYALKRDYLVSKILSEIDTKTGLISKGVVPNKELQEMIKKADNLGGSYKVGDWVEIKAGELSGFEGEVVDVWHDGTLRHYTILIKMRSVEVLTKVDCLSLEG
jgi:transcription antitermination factor NusG